MVAFPILATAVAAWFAGACVREARRRRSPALGVWGFALLQYAVASGATAWGVGAGWSPPVFRVFYLFGAVLNVAWLGLGTVWLLGPRLAAPFTYLLVVASVFAGGVVFAEPLLAGAGQALREATIPASSAVLPDGVRVLSRWFSIGGSVVVLAGLGWSAARRRAGSAGLLLLAAGVVIAALASELARAGVVGPFSAGLATGVAVMYAGFVRTGTGRPGGSVGG